MGERHGSRASIFLVKRFPLVAGLLLLLAGSALGETKLFPSVPAVYPLINRVGFTSTALTNGAYTTLASPTLTLGTSNGPSGAWDVRVILQTANNSNTLAYPCITGANAGTSAAGSYDGTDAVVCHNSPANMLAGATTIGLSTRPTISEYSATYANGATVAFTCSIFATTTAQTSSGYCVEEAWPI
jgi:hypothetical protein